MQKGNELDGCSRTHAHQIILATYVRSTLHTNNQVNGCFQDNYNLICSCRPSSSTLSLSLYTALALATHLSCLFPNSMSSKTRHFISTSLYTCFSFIYLKLHAHRSYTLVFYVQMTTRVWTQQHSTRDESRIRFEPGYRLIVSLKLALGFFFTFRCQFLHFPFGNKLHGTAFFFQS